MGHVPAWRRVPPTSCTRRLAHPANRRRIAERDALLVELDCGRTRRGHHQEWKRVNGALLQGHSGYNATQGPILVELQEFDIGVGDEYPPKEIVAAVAAKIVDFAEFMVHDVDTRRGTCSHCAFGATERHFASGKRSKETQGERPIRWTPIVLDGQEAVEEIRVTRKGGGVLANVFEVRRRVGAARSSSSTRMAHSEVAPTPGGRPEALVLRYQPRSM